MIKKLDLHKLIDREPVDVSLTTALSYVKGKRVLVTGAGGSIGSELSRQLLFGGVERLFLFGHGENSIYKVKEKLTYLSENKYKIKVQINPVIGELQDKQYMDFIMKRLKADVVFHTAAHKHVPLTEENPVETIKNNVFGFVIIIF